ncbi:hypothetical protein ATO50_01120 [Aeromonas hydrophila]|nr:hypothetical protein ATO50_01120 [Aeromonas hydrophila]
MNGLKYCIINNSDISFIKASRILQHVTECNFIDFKNQTLRLSNKMPTISFQSKSSWGDKLERMHFFQPVDIVHIQFRFMTSLLVV